MYGLGADGTNERALKKIYEAKGRASDNPLILHIADIQELTRYVRFIPEGASPARLADAFWPGPLTMIFERNKDVVPAAASGGLDTVAIRFPSEKTASMLIKAASTAIAAPSANLSGKPSPTKASHVINDLDGRVDMILAGGTCKVGLESTVISMIGEVPTLLRPGGITYEMLRERLGEVKVDKGVTAKVENGEKAASPGMKYKHYAPLAKATLVKGEGKRACRYIQSRLTGDKGECVVCFDEEAAYFENVQVFPYGKEEDMTTQAKRIFDVLRLLDEKGMTRAYIRCPEGTGIGLAVYNRLLRAAAFDEVLV